MNSFFPLFLDLSKTQIALIPQPLLPLWEKGSEINFLFPSLILGEGLGVRVLAIAA